MNEIKAKLLEMQQAIIDEIEDDHNKSVSAITHDIGDSIDYAAEERDREFYQLLGERDRIKLQMIKEALERFEDESYGLCEDCDAEIGKARLLALPFTKLCVDCKSEEERTKGNDLSFDLGNPKFSSMDGDDI